MKTHLHWFVMLLMMLVGFGVLESSVGYANPNGGFEVPEVREDFDEFKPAPKSQKEQPINDTEVQTEEKGFWDETTELVKEGWQWVNEKGSDFIDWTKEAAAAF